MRNLDKKGIVFIFVLWLMALAVFLCGVLAHAQMQMNRRQSPSTAVATVTLKGTVEKVLHRDCSLRLLPLGANGVHAFRCADLLVSTKDGLINLLLGPTKFIRDNHFFFANGDQVIAIGFRAANDRRVVVVAEEVVKSKRALAFRDPNGRPLWKAYEQNGTISKHAISQAAGHSSTKPLDSTFLDSSSSKIATNPKTSESPKEKENAKYSS